MPTKRPFDNDAFVPARAGESRELAHLFGVKRGSGRAHLTCDSEISRYTVGDGDSRGIPFTESTTGPKNPDEQSHAITPITIRRSELAQTAMLLHRVDPVYPTLARQLRREDRVELRATIATDGSIQALEVISGDPLFLPSALSAVHQWRYRPTILDGQPVEVETQITVIYHLQN